MATTRISTAVANPIRTGVQLGVADAITEFIDAFHLVSLDPRQYAALLALLTIAIGVIQNAVENYKGKGFLRVPTSKAPVVGQVVNKVDGNA